MLISKIPNGFRQQNQQESMDDEGNQYGEEEEGSEGQGGSWSGVGGGTMG